MRPARCSLVTLLLLVTGITSAAATPADRNPAEPHPRARTSTVQITDDPLGVPPVSADLVGGNLRWLDEADGAWDPRRQRIRTSVAALSKRIGVRSIRYAGGTVANLFDHRKAMGRPGCQTSGGFASPHFSAIPARRSGYTIRRHALFAKRGHARTNVMVPMINTTAARARAFVRAVAEATGQRRITVEIGNEPILEDQRYWRSKPLDDRLDDYILGGSRRQHGNVGDTRLYPAKGCELRKSARADGSANQRYRPRYTPIDIDRPPSIEVAGRTWTYRPTLDDAEAGDRVFTVDPSRRLIRFGDGVHGARPDGAMKIDYVAGPMLGFIAFYNALQDVPGVQVDVCSSWATGRFVRRMDELGADYDCLGVHQYAVIKGSRRIRAMTENYLAKGQRTNRKLATLTAAMRNSPRPDAAARFLAVTEFGGFHRSGAHRGREFVMDLLRAVELIGQVDNGVRLSNASNYNTLFERYGSAFAISGTGYLEFLLRQMVGQTPVRVEGLPSGLVGTATRSGRRTALLVVNTNWSGERTARLRVSDRGPAECVAVRTLQADPGSSTRGQTLASRPTSAKPIERAVWTDGSLKRRFPAHSVSLLTLTPRRDGRCPTIGWP